ncbi:MAG: hypothetical protein ACC669_01895, partial [bacterium]
MDVSDHRVTENTEKSFELGFSPRRHGEHGERKKPGIGVIWRDKSFNAEGRWPPIRADRRGPQCKIIVLGLLEIRN